MRTLTRQEPHYYDSCQQIELFLKKIPAQIILEWPVTTGWVGYESLGLKVKRHPGEPTLLHATSTKMMIKMYAIKMKHSH